MRFLIAPVLVTVGELLLLVAVALGPDPFTVAALALGTLLTVATYGLAYAAWSKTR